MATRLQASPFSRRTPVDPRETYDVTTPGLQVVASPTDPLVRTDAGSGLRQLVQALGPISQGLRAYGQDMDRRFQEDIERGRLARAKGEELPKQASPGLIKGYETFKGELTARKEYKADLTAIQNEMDSLAPEELEERLQGLTQAYLDGATEDFVRGFIPVALQLEESVLSRYQARQQELFQAEVVENISQIAQDTVTSALDSSLSPVFGLSSIEDIQGNGAIYQALEQGNLSESYSSILHQKLRELHQQGKTFGLSKSEVSELFLDQVGQEAVRLGVPELLEFAEKKDQSGISLSGSTLGSKVESYRNQAKSRRETLRRAFDDEASDARQALVDSAVKESWSALYDASAEESPVRAADMASQILDRLNNEDVYQEISNAEYRQLYQFATDLTRGRFGFPEIGNDQRYADLRLEATMGSLNLAAINLAREENDLSRDQYITLVEEFRKQQDRQEAEAAKWPDKQFIDEIQRQARDVVSGFDEFNNPLNPTSALRFTNNLQREINDFRELHGRSPNYKEYVQEILEPSLVLEGISLEQVMSGGEGQVGTVVPQDPREALRAEAEGLQERAQGALQSIFNTVDQLGEQRGWWDIDTLREQATVKFQEAEDALGFDLSDMYQRLNIAFFQRNGTVQQIEEALTEAGESPEAIELYTTHFALTFAKAALANESFSDAVDAARFIREHLTKAGYDRAFVDRTIFTSRQEGGEDS